VPYSTDLQEYRVIYQDMPSTCQPSIADLSREMRSRLRLTQEQFAHQLGVTYLTVNRWENGHTKPSRLAMKQVEAKLQEMSDQGADLLQQYFGVLW